MTPNDTLMEQCREDARQWVIQRAFEADPSVEDTHRWEEYVTAMEQDHITVYAAALYHERSKPRTSLSVEDVMALMSPWAERWFATDPLSPTGMACIDLRERLTAKINELNTTDNDRA